MGLSGPWEDHAALAKARLASEIQSNQCRNLASSVHCRLRRP
jgi:hypothetical protein